MMLENERAKNEERILGEKFEAGEESGKDPGDPGRGGKKKVRC